MYQLLSVSLSPDGSGERPIPHSAPYGGGRWHVDTPSVVRGWSSQPMFCGSGGMFMDAIAVVLSLTPTRRRTTADGKLVFEGWAPPGGVRVQRPGEVVTSEMLTPFDQIVFYIPMTTFRSVLREQDRSDDDVFDIIDPLWRTDKVIDANLRCAILALNNKNKSTYHYIHNMSRSLASHILYQYADGRGQCGDVDDIKSPQVRRALDFIDANIEQSLSLVEMAAAAGQPMDRFRREFKLCTQMSPHQYLIKRRVDRACELIASSRKPRFAEIALECGFADQSHLSTTFRRVLGVSPAKFARRH